MLPQPRGSRNDEIRRCVDKIGAKHCGGPFEHGERFAHLSDRSTIPSLGGGIGRLGVQDRPEKQQRARHSAL
jgi:hypothetical protein